MATVTSTGCGCEIVVEVDNGGMHSVKFQIGDGEEYTPTAGTKNYENPTMKGINSGVIIRNGLPMLSGYSIIADGGFSLTGTGDVFSDGEQFVWIY